MALTIKNLGRGPVGTASPTDVVQAVLSGKSVLVDNVIFVNTIGTATTFTVSFYDSSAAATIAIVTSLAMPGNGRWVLEPITLDVGDKLTAQAGAGSALEFVASGVEKDL